MKKNTSIVACGKTFDIGRRVVLWDEPGGLNHYLENTVAVSNVDRKTGKLIKSTISGKRYTSRNIKFETLQNILCNFTVHHSVTYRAAETYNGLHNGRKLSVNFIIDDDKNATIYQCLDIKDIGWSQGECNGSGPGVEICYHPEAWQNPSAYSEAIQTKYKVQPHEISNEVIHNQKFKVFKPTDEQIESLCALLWGYCELFPNIKPKFPKDEKGHIKTTIKNPAKYSGLLGHFHITRNKIDPMGIDFKYVEKSIEDRLAVGY